MIYWKSTNGTLSPNYISIFRNLPKVSYIPWKLFRNFGAYKINFYQFSFKQRNIITHKNTQSIIAHQSLICHPNTVRQTHSLPWESAQRASSHSHHRKEGNRKAWEDGWLHNSPCECSHPADVRNFSLNLKRICCGLISFTGT